METYLIFEREDGSEPLKIKWLDAISKIENGIPLFISFGKGRTKLKDRLNPKIEKL